MGLYFYIGFTNYFILDITCNYCDLWSFIFVVFDLLILSFFCLHLCFCIFFQVKDFISNLGIYEYRPKDLPDENV